MAGNILGARRYYSYTTDNGDAYKYQTDENLGSAVGATLNDTNPDLPRRFQPRGVYVENSTGQRKFVICPTTSTTVYNQNSSTDITIDGTTFSATGRRGERMTFGTNPASQPET